MGHGTAAVGASAGVDAAYYGFAAVAFAAAVGSAVDSGSGSGRCRHADAALAVHVVGVVETNVRAVNEGVVVAVAASASASNDLLVHVQVAAVHVPFDLRVVDWRARSAVAFAGPVAGPLVELRAVVGQLA